MQRAGLLRDAPSCSAGRAFSDQESQQRRYAHHELQHNPGHLGQLQKNDQHAEHGHDRIRAPRERCRSLRSPLCRAQREHGVAQSHVIAGQTIDDFVESHVRLNDVPRMPNVGGRIGHEDP